MQRVVFLRTGFACAHLNSSGNKPEQSDAFIMYVIGLIKTSRHAFSNTVGNGPRSHDLRGDDIIIFLTSAVVACECVRLILSLKLLEKELGETGASCNRSKF